MILEILEQLRNTSSTKEKFNILLSHKDNKDLEKVLKYTYDKVDFTYGVTPSTVLDFDSNEYSDKEMFEVLDILNRREVTGHKALALAKNFYESCDKDIKELFLKILDRDLKIGVNEKTLNKVFKGIVSKPNYCRCDLLSEKTLKKFTFPGFIQLKCDGTYREAYVHNGIVEFKTRSGESYRNPVLEEILKTLPDGYYLGEFTIGEADDPDMNRAEGNGLINSDHPPYEKIHFTIWDLLTEDEYALKVKECRNYDLRLADLQYYIEQLGSELVHVVPTYRVYNPDGALKIVSKWMNEGLEGGVLKSFNMKFKNGTSKEQLKIKLKVDVEVRCTGFIEGTKGTKYEGKNKVITFENDEGTIKGQCSGMTDSMVEEVTKNPEKYIGKVLSVQFNDLTKAEGHEYYALSHPRFAEWRDHDKDCTDSLEKAIQLRDMARGLK